MRHLLKAGLSAFILVVIVFILSVFILFFTGTSIASQGAPEFFLYLLGSIFIIAFLANCVLIILQYYADRRAEEAEDAQKLQAPPAPTKS